MELLKVDSLNEAVEKLYNQIKNDGGSIDIEEISVSESFGRILASDIISSFDVPEFDRSIVDGFAVIASDTNGATDTIPTFLNVVGESEMGKACDTTIKNGECVYVPTGGMLPKGATACVMVEYVENITDKKIAIYDAVADGKNIVRIGDDIKNGSKVLSCGRKIKASDMGLISSLGIDKIKVFKNLTISIISTGDELLGKDEEYSFGKIRDINTNLLVGLSKKYGFKVINTYLLKDSEKQISDTLEKALKDSDIVVMSGGSSKGKKDTSSLVIDKLTSSKVLTHGIAIKPGKPTITAYDKNTNTIMVGLPGHPVASAILFNLVVVGVIKKLTSQTDDSYICEGILTENLAASPGRMTIQLVNVDSEFNVTPIYGKSGLINTLSQASGYIIVEKDNEGINRGEKVVVHYL